MQAELEHFRKCLTLPALFLHRGHYKGPPPRWSPSPCPLAIRDLGNQHPVPRLRLRAQSCTDSWGWGGEHEDEAELTAQQEDWRHSYELGQYQCNSGWHRESASSLDSCVLEITNGKSHNQKKKKNHLAAVELEWGWVTEHTVKIHTCSSSHRSSMLLGLHFRVNCYKHCGLWEVGDSERSLLVEAALKCNYPCFKSEQKYCLKLVLVFVLLINQTVYFGFQYSSKAGDLKTRSWLGQEEWRQGGRKDKRKTNEGNKEGRRWGEKAKWCEHNTNTQMSHHQ